MNVPRDAWICADLTGPSVSLVSAYLKPFFVAFQPAAGSCTVWVDVDAPVTLMLSVAPAVVGSPVTVFVLLFSFAATISERFSMTPGFGSFTRIWPPRIAWSFTHACALHACTDGGFAPASMHDASS